MNYKKEMEAGTLKVLTESQKAGEHYVPIEGREFVVYPGVFSPAFFKDTEFFIRHVPVRKGDYGLEIGPGCGAFSVFAALKGAYMDAIDINPDAVANTKVNAFHYGVQNQVNVLEGNVYTPKNGVLKYAPYDWIYWNVPFNLPKDPNAVLTDLERSVSDPGYKGIRRSIFEAQPLLKSGAPLLLGTSLQLGQDNLIFELLHEAKFQAEIMRQGSFKEGGNLVDYTLIRAER